MSRPLLAYFGLTYLITWAFTVPFVILWHTTMDGSLPWWVIVFVPGAYGPTIAAIIMTARAEGGSGVRTLLQRLLRWRVGLIWYAFALLVPATVVAVAVLCSSFRVEAVRGFDPWPGLSIAPLAFVFALPFGPLAEELGWRGYAQPRLMAGHGLWATSLLLGLAWTIWHVPMFWFPGAAIPSFLDPGPMSVSLYLAQITAEACLLTFLYVVTRGSVLLAVLYHASFNTAETIVLQMIPDLPETQELQVYVLTIVLSWILAFILLTGLQRRSRSR